MYFERNPESTTDFVRSVLEDYQPTKGRLFLESVKFGYNTLWFNELIDEYNYDQAASQSPISLEEYKQSRFFRHGVNYYHGMTLGQAEILSENHDRKAYYSNLTKNVSWFSGLGAIGFGGLLAGSLPDPLNYVPYWGMAKVLTRAKTVTAGMKTAKTMQMAGKIPKNKATAKMVLSIGDPMIGAGLATYITREKRKKFQEEWDFGMVLTDALIAGGIGFSMWGAGRMARRLRKSGDESIIDQTAKGSEQFEETGNTSPDLKPSGGNSKGFNYGNPINKAIRTQTGSAIFNGTVNVSEKTFVRVETLSAKDSESMILTVNELLDVANSDGFAGIHLSDDIDPVIIWSILNNIDNTELKLETRPDSNGHTIERISDDANWNHVPRDQEARYDPENEAPEPDYGRNEQAENDFYSSLQEDETFATNSSRMKESDLVGEEAQRVKEGVESAASCVNRNG